MRVWLLRVRASESALRSLLVLCRSQPELAVSHVLPGLQQPLLLFVQPASRSDTSLPPSASVAASLSAVVATSVAHPSLFHHSLPLLLTAVHSQLDGTQTTHTRRTATEARAGNGNATLCQCVGLC